MKKSFLVLIAILTFSFQSNAQIEVSTNPIGLLFNTYIISVDYHTSPDWSFGGEMGINTANSTRTASAYYANAKHYFNPFSDAKMFYVGTFAGVFSYNYEIITLGENQSTFGVGFMGGYKLVSRKNVVMDLGLGLGRGVINSGVLPYFRANLGYRFGTVKDKSVETPKETF